MTLWKVPKMWEGETCAILASGISMSQAIADTVRESGVRAIAVCRTVELAPWADMVYAADAAWWNAFHKKVQSFAGLKVTCEENPFPGILRLKIGDMDGFNSDPGTVATGGNSGYQAICIAAHAGCKRILLCGFDMHGKHWHEDYKGSGLRNTEGDTFYKWIRRFPSLREPLESRGIELINCTPNSALRPWPPFVGLHDALALEKASA